MCKAAEEVNRHGAKLHRKASSALIEQIVDGGTSFISKTSGTVTLGDKLRGLRQAKKPLVARKADDPAAILFTSGRHTEGRRSAHRNMLASARPPRASTLAHGQGFNAHRCSIRSGCLGFLPLVSAVPSPSPRLTGSCGVGLR
jgi:hypothetical protein